MDITRSPLFPQPVNDFGQVVGDFTLRGPSVGFLYDAGTVCTDVVTGSLRFSYLGGINDTDQFTGSVVTPDGALEAMLISHGVLQAFTYPGSTATEGHGINNWGQVVGDYTDAGGTHGFVGTPDHLSAIDVPDGSHTVAYAINDWRQIAGSYQGAAAHQHGFLDTGGHYARIDVPGAQTTSVTGINDWGQIVGYYDDGTNHRHGFVRTDGQFQTLDVSGASVTSAMGINNLGEIVGYADFPGAEGFPPQAQVWVARPSFIHDPSSAGTALSDTGSSGMGLPKAADVAALLRGIVENRSGQPDLTSWLADPTSAPMPATIASLEAAFMGSSGPQAWTMLHSAQTWSLGTQQVGGT